MTRSRRGVVPKGRLAAAIAAVACLVPTAAACDAGNNAPTLQWHPQSAGINTTVGGITINNAFVLGPQFNNSIAAGRSAGFYMAMVNEGTSTDRLVSVTAPGTAKSVQLPKGGIVLAGQPVYLTGPKAKIVLRHLTHALTGGQDVRIVLTFAKEGAITMTVPVLSRSNDYATFSPAPVVTSSPTKTKHATGLPSSLSAGQTDEPTPSTSP